MLTCAYLCLYLLSQAFQFHHNIIIILDSFQQVFGYFPGAEVLLMLHSKSVLQIYPLSHMGRSSYE